jgi:hypothetical protein
LKAVSLGIAVFISFHLIKEIIIMAIDKVSAPDSDNLGSSKEQRTSTNPNQAGKSTSQNNPSESNRSTQNAPNWQQTKQGGSSGSSSEKDQQQSEQNKNR